MRKDEIQGFVNSIRAKSPLELTNGVIDNNMKCKTGTGVHICSRFQYSKWFTFLHISVSCFR